MRSTFHALIVVALAAVAVTGCKSKPKTGPYDGGALITPQEMTVDGVPLAGNQVPFDADPNRSPVSDANLSPVYFGYDSFQLAPEEIAKIEQAADYLNRNASHVMIIEGHCDERGSNEYNLSLGEQRALAIREYLVTLGVSADRMQSRSFGEERPAVQGADESAWRMNRRGEFAVYQ